MHAQKANSEYKIRGRPAHGSHINKTGMSWKAKETDVCFLAWHDTHTDHPYYTTTGKTEKMNEGPVSCQKCGDVIRYDPRGYAFCNCKIWNDSITQTRNNYLDRDFLKSLKFNYNVPGAV